MYAITRLGGKEVPSGKLFPGVVVPPGSRTASALLVNSGSRQMEGSPPRVTLSFNRFSQTGPGSTVCDKSSLPASLRFRSDEELLPRDQSVDSPKEQALYLRGAARNHYGEGAGEVLRASSDNHWFLSGVGRQSPKRFFSPILQNQRNCFSQVRQAFLVCFSLTIRARHLCAVRHKPRSVLLDNCGELVVQ